MTRAAAIAACGIVALCALLAVAPARAGEVRPFTADSYAGIVAARDGRPFILVLWSVACTHCPKELQALGDLRRRYAGLDIVLVATDTPQEADEVATRAAGHGLGDTEQWVFADEVPERLRLSIDRRWHGELPRTYFIAGDKAPEAVSGIVPAARLDAWARGHAR